MKWLKLSDGERRYKKPILRVGEFVKESEGVKFSITQEHLQFLKESFKTRVPVPLEHTTDPDKNRGWVSDLEIENDVLFGVFELSEMIEDPNIFDTSVYMPIEEGRLQPLKHVALTSYPVVDGLGKFEAIVASLTPTKEETEVAFNWKALGVALGLSDLTEENAEDKLTEHFKSQSEEVKSLKLQLSDTNPKINIEQIKKQHGKLFQFAKDGKKSKIESLPLSKAAKDKLIEHYCSDDILALSLSEDYFDDFDVIIDALEQHESLEFGEVSGVQLSDPLKGKTKTSSIVELARKRAEAAKGGN